MSEKAPQSYVPESLKDSQEQPTSTQVLDAFAGKQEELVTALNEVQARPGFKLDANEMMAKRREEKAYKEELDSFTSAYNELGGADIEAAQAAVDALDFKSDANDHVRAKAALTAARNKFYENFLASQQEEEVSPEASADKESSSEVKSKFTVGDSVRVKRTSGDIEDDWAVAGISDDGKYVTVGKPAPDNKGFLRKTVPAEVLNNIQEDGSGASELSADDLEIIDEDGASIAPSRSLRDRMRRAGRRARRMTSLPGLAAEMSTSAHTRRERNGGLLSRRERIAAAMGGAALLIGGGLLLMKGHDIFGGNGGGGAATPDTTPSNGGGSGTGTPEVPPQGPDTGSGNGPETVRVNPGDGEIKVTQRILANHGIDVSTADAQRIGENAGVHDILRGDSSYAHSGSTMDRIGSTGDFKIRKGVSARLIESANKLGLGK